MDKTSLAEMNTQRIQGLLSFSTPLDVKGGCGLVRFGLAPIWRKLLKYLGTILIIKYIFYGGCYCWILREVQGEAGDE